MTIEIKKQYDLVDYETSVEFMQLRVNQIFNKSKRLIYVYFMNHTFSRSSLTSPSVTGSGCDSNSILSPLIGLSQVLWTNYEFFVHVAHTSTYNICFSLNSRYFTS